MCRIAMLPSVTSGKTQVAAARILSMPLSDPAISHTSIDTMVRGLFKYFLGNLRYSAGLGPVAPPLIRFFLLKDRGYFFIMRLITRYQRLKPVRFLIPLS